MRFCAAVAFASLFLLSACALHPIPEDVVRVSTKEIVEHIRCEIREALKVYAYKKNKRQFTEANLDEAVLNARKKDVFDVISATRRKVFDWIHNEAYVRTREVATVSTADEFNKIVKLQSENKNIACEVLGSKHVGLSDCPQDKNENGETIRPARKGAKIPTEDDDEDEDEDKEKNKDSLMVKMRKLIDKVYEDPTCIRSEVQLDKILFPPPPEDIKPKDDDENFVMLRFNDLTTRRDKLKIRFECLQAKHEYYQVVEDPKKATGKEKEALARALNNAQRKCDKLPEKQFPSALTMCQVGTNKLGEKSDKEVRTQRIELAEEALNKAFKGIVVGYGFEFTMTDTDTANIGLDFRLPFTNGTFDLGIALSEEKARQNKRTFDLAEAVPHLLADTAKCDDMRRANWRYPIAGEIGLAETVKAYSSLARIKGFFPERKNGENEEGGKGKGDNAKASEFSEEIEFTTEISGGPSPMLSLSPVPKQFRLIKMSPNISHARKDVHKVTITFIKVDKSKKPGEDLYPEAIARTFVFLKELRALTTLSTKILRAK